VIRTGVVLPTFRDSPDAALEVARAAFAAGVDGVFCYDHIWPIGQPERPALAPFPVLAAVAAEMADRPTGADGGGPYVGTLVARVGLAPNPVLVRQFSTLHHLAPGRVIAGLGTGDRLSEAENVAYGIPFDPPEERWAQLTELASALGQLAMPVWIAGGPAGRTDEARATGAALNVWDAPPALVTERTQGPGGVEVTWAGPPPPSVRAMTQTVRSVAAAGASWAVFGWPVDLPALAASSNGSRSGS
jgi:alkanesulfonate monooxygenase SsuD/methylene tetrahydromethanopterin reductase-like flavin-dependent oxidoreductase (luciferase family)